MNKKLISEIKFHNKRFEKGKDLRNGFEKFYKVTIQSQNFFKQCIKNNIKKNLNKKLKLLDYGCGIDAHGYLGTNKFQQAENIFDFYKKLKVNFFGIDISNEAIKIAKKNAKKINFKAIYKVMDAEKLSFDNNFFDVIVGKGIIHHLNYDKALSELSRVVNNMGACIFFEPLHHHPIIQLGRKLTPGSRTKDEHPIRYNEKKIFNKYFNEVNFHTFCLFNILAFIFHRTFLFPLVLKRLTMLDDFLLKTFPYLKKYCWIVVIELKSPKLS